MAGREVTLCLKYPGSTHNLQRLQQSYLECVVEYKAGSEAELQTKPPANLFSKYQMKGTATVADDEIVIEFKPRNSGVHCARLFADTREICRPVPFIVTQRGETVSLPPDRPVQKPPAAAADSATSTLERGRTPAFYGLNNPRFPSPVPPQSVMSDATTAAQTEPPHARSGLPSPEHVRGYNSDLDLAADLPEQKRTVAEHFSPRASYISSGAARRHSTAATDVVVGNGAQRFDELYTKRNTKAGGRERLFGTRRGPLSIDYQTVVTRETLRMLGKEADVQMKVYRGEKVKRRCDICSKKMKATKCVSLGDEDYYCDSCFRRQFLLHSAIDHFMVPCVEECNIQVPINKKATKFITARKTIVNVNLRGLEPVHVRMAQEEFHKFDMDNNGWIRKAVLLPLLKACLSLSGVSDRESMLLLGSQTLRSTVSSYGLDKRGEVHEIEFLSLFSFIMREREQLRATTNLKSKGIFTRNDLEMAYAFRRQMNRGGGGGHENQLVEGSLPQQRGGFYSNSKSPMEASGFEKMGYSSISPSPSDMADVGRQRTHLPLSSPQRHFTGFTEPIQLFPGNHGNQNPRLHRQSVTSSDYVPLGDRLAARRAVAHKRASIGGGGGGGGEGGGGDRVEELAEEDQDEEEAMIHLPSDKDPAAKQRTSSFIGKSSPNKQMMEDVNKELKITGGKADAWMLY